MTLLLIVVGWFLISVPLGLVIGGAANLRDRHG